MKNNKWRIKIICAFILFFAFFSLSDSVVRAQQVTLSISPPILEVFIKPGKSILIAYKVGNSGDPVVATAKVLPFEPKDQYGNINIKPEFEGPVRFSLDNANISLEQPFFMQTKDSQQLLLRIRIPDGAPEGDYYYTLLVETQPPPTIEGAPNTSAKATIGSNILITVTNTGMTEAKGKIALFDILPRFSFSLFGRQYEVFDSSDKIPVILVVDNQGKNLIKPQGEITLRGNFGETANYEVIPQNILAESQRQLAASPSASVDCQTPGKGSVYCRKSVSLLLSGFFVGMYRLSTSLTFGDFGPKISAATSFIALPFKLLFGVFTAVLLAILLVRHFTKPERD